MGHLWLVGMMGAGKSSVGHRVAARLQVPFVDSDQEVEELIGSSIEEIFTSLGEGRFRTLERRIVAGIARTSPAVVATGGGVVLDDENVEVMRATGLVVWLQAPPAILAARTSADGPTRPLLQQADPAARLARILADRRERYEATAHIAVDNADRSLGEVVEEVISAWRGS
jgi:shikimate kinase